jgi:hypothetical protein
MGLLGVRGGGLGDPRRSLKYCTHLILCYKGFKGPPKAFIDTLGVRGNFFEFKGSTEQKKG